MLNKDSSPLENLIFIIGSVHMYILTSGADWQRFYFYRVTSNILKVKVFFFFFLQILKSCELRRNGSAKTPCDYLIDQMTKWIILKRKSSQTLPSSAVIWHWVMAIKIPLDWPLHPSRVVIDRKYAFMLLVINNYKYSVIIWAKKSWVSNLNLLPFKRNSNHFF